jgi:anti-anti-sigma factor
MMHLATAPVPAVDLWMGLGGGFVTQLSYRCGAIVNEGANAEPTAHPSGRQATVDNASDRDRIPIVEVVVTETMDVNSASRLTATLGEALRIRPDQLIIDLEACPSIDAAGIAVLLDTHRRVRRDGGYLTLRAPSDRLRRNLRLARTDHVLHIIPGCR